MRQAGYAFLAATWSLWASPALAADALKFGPPPGWAVPLALPDAKSSDAPVTVLLNDQQIAFEPGKVIAYAHAALRLDTAEGLAAGNIGFSWEPTTQSVTVNKLHIRRGGKVIDVLGAGQTFTIVRRETNLEAAMLDGTLTANIQPEGLQQGDIVELATTTEQVDPVMKGHVETLFAGWNGVPIELAHAALSWPGSLKMSVRQSRELRAARKSAREGRTHLDLSLRSVEPLIAPKAAPLRFRLGRMAEASSFQSWAEVAELMMPLYRDAAVLPSAGPLRDEVQRIKAATSDPAERAERALALVQDRVRYVALSMGQGGLVPASAESTWSRRFGDCKGKTALLLALLKELGISGQPVLVSTSAGDAIADRLPMVGVFDHVLVRAEVGGKIHWLDGTRSGDSNLELIEVPNFGWGLPVVAAAQLTRIVPPPLSLPMSDTQLTLDATAGIRVPAPATAQQVLRGNTAQALHRTLSSLTAAQRHEGLKSYWKEAFDFISVKSSSSSFDKERGELRLSMAGDAKLDWSSGMFHVANSSVGGKPDLDRPAGPLSEVPVLVPYPTYVRTSTAVKLPPGFFGNQSPNVPDVRETLAGVEYRRTSRAEGDTLIVETSQRSLVPEISYKEARAAEARLTALADEDIALRLPSSYRPTEQDIRALTELKPASADEFMERGLVLLDQSKFKESIADFTEVAARTPKSPWPLANRAIARVWLREFADAEKDLAAAEALDNGNYLVLRARGLMAELKGEWTAALEAYTRSLQKQASSWTLYRRALAHRALKDDAKALADAAAVLETTPDFTDARLLRANILYAQGERDGARREADLLVKEPRAPSYGLVAAARIYARIGDRPASMRTFDRALAVKRESFIYINRAQSRPLKDHAGRLADLNLALELEPDNVIALAEKAEQLAVMGDTAGGARLYDAVVKAEPDNANLATGRAVMLYKAGRRAEAEKILAERRRKAETSGEFNNLCWTKATSGILLQSALEDCREALRLDPQNGAAMDSLAFLSLRLGKPDEAIALYDKAIAQRVGAPSYMGRSHAHAAKGDKARAAADRAEALKLDPDVETRFAEYGLKP